MIELTRKQILEGKYEYPKGYITIKPTNHYLERLEERGIGLACVPWTVKVTKDNIYSGKTWDGKNLTSVVIKLKFSRWEDVFICLNPFDCGGKSIWFKEKRSRLT